MKFSFSRNVPFFGRVRISNTTKLWRGLLPVLRRVRQHLSSPLEIQNIQRQYHISLAVSCVSRENCFPEFFQIPTLSRDSLPHLSNSCRSSLIIGALTWAGSHSCSAVQWAPNVRDNFAITS